MDGDPELALLNEWRQGDLALTPFELPLVAWEGGHQVVLFAKAPDGVAIISQSCDIVRCDKQKPWVQVAGLVPATDDELQRVKAGHVPSRLYLPALGERNLVIDLEIIATIDKETVARWPRTQGCANDDEQRTLAAALARHRQRFAFPDEFNDLIRPVRRWVEQRRKKNSPQGEVIRLLREIRVTVDNWAKVETLIFYALTDVLPSEEQYATWKPMADKLSELATHPLFAEAEFRLVTYDDISAREYIRSDRLDWDGLSDA